MPSNDPATAASQVAPLEIVINPLVNWIWLGFGVIAFGTGIALLPERAYSFALAKMPAEAVTTTMLVLLALAFSSPRLLAQAGMPAGGGAETQTSYYARTPFEKQMQHEIVCTCGCGHINIGECRKDPCLTSHNMRRELAAMIDEGKSRNEILTSFVQNYGSQEMLGAPIDKGFSRLAWLFPIALGGGAACVIGFVAMRWSRRHPAVSDSGEPADHALDERLDDELRDLD
jgi:cytochrome c-type biogenesis protein CcmF